jgi:hypothetical protein
MKQMSKKTNKYNKIKKDLAKSFADDLDFYDFS